MIDHFKTKVTDPQLEHSDSKAETRKTKRNFLLTEVELFVESNREVQLNRNNLQKQLNNVFR